MLDISAIIHQSPCQEGKMYDFDLILLLCCDNIKDWSIKAENDDVKNDVIFAE